VLFCRESPTVPFGGEVDEDEIVFPGDGVPEQAGGVQVYVRPDVGLTVFDRVTVELFNVPAVVDAQFVVVVLLLKLVFVLPLKPISNVLAVALVGPCIL
jgi:hypothetical protein